MLDIQKYSGTWNIFEKETVYQGELHISYDNRVIALEILLPASEGIPFPRTPYKGKIPYICGTLFSGAKILLYDCSTGKEHTHVMQYTQQIIYAKYAFWGLSVNSIEEIRFTKAIFDFGDIIAWSDLCNYKWEFAEDGGTNLIWVHKEPVKFKLSENLEITLSPSQGIIGGDMFEKEIKAKQHISIELVYKNPTSWESIMNDALCMQYLIGLGVNQKVEIDSGQYCHSSIYIELPKDDGISEKVYRPVDMVWGTGKIEPTQNTKPYHCLYTLSNIKESNTFIRWYENYSMLKPVLDLYFTAFSHTAGTPEMLFLNLTQALETYHSRFIIDDAKAYSDRVDNLVDSFCHGNNNTEHWKNFLLDEGQKKNTHSIYLRSRLADLAFANGVLPFWPNRCLPVEYIRKVVDTRNYYTHYNPAKLERAFTKVELPWVNGHLLALLGYHLLILMGFDTDEVRKKTVEKISQIDDAYQIQEHTHDIER
ncbi:MAG: hypothetical protein E6274_06420 [Clostridium sp.]|uniref:ApeA N-terminal domain 1-containing protein n=1 Tax=Clostridium sp. TaxID=1506 RepID=UPI00290A6E2F|nr:HEPN domain-containing protein [Clostridium sp.]MDU7251952.1 hypothetical protein [Clostridium sp.]